MKPNNQIHIIGYPEDNLSKHPSINQLLKIYPTLGGEIEKILRGKKIHKDKEFSMGELPKGNSFDLKNFKNDKKSLVEVLDKLSEILGDKKPIVFLSDGCFTNELFTRELCEILGDDYDKYVEEVKISYEDESQNKHIPNYLYKNSILILGGSLTNLEDVPQKFYDSKLVDFIKKVHNNKINSKLIGICWGHQFISHIIGLDEVLSEKIITTYTGEAQFGVMPSELTININNVPFAYRGVLNTITNNGQNTTVSSILTRTGHIDLDFLKSYRLESQSLIPLLIDPITKSSRACGSRNSQYFGVQDHHEINPIKDTDILYENISKSLKGLISIYGYKVEKILLNIEKQSKFENDLGKPFYASILLSFANSIISKHEYKKNHINKNINGPQFANGEKITEEELKLIISKENFGSKLISDKNPLQELDKQGFLKLVSYLDWSINRGSIESSNILGFDLIQLIQKHKTFLETHKINTGSYVFRDLGAGKGKLIDDVENENSKTNKQDGKKELDMIAYGVSDYAYFNIYEGLISLEEFNDIPKNIFKIFLEELITYYKELNTGNEKEKIIQSLNRIKLNAKSYKLCTMFSNSTTYRFNDQEEKLTKKDEEFLKHNIYRINDLKEFIKNNFYDLVKGTYDKMIFSDFNSLYINNKIIKGIDFQTAIRSTCHIDSNNIQALAKDYIDYFAKPGSIFVDNGIIRSDSGVPRIKEFIDLEKENNNIKVTFVYDTKTSYITSAIINKAPYIPEEEIKSCLQDGYILLSTDEIGKGCFFKIERFFRELIIFTFKNLQFSHDKNKYIIKILKEISSDMSNKAPEQIKEMIIEKINFLIIIINTEYDKSYTKMDGKIFDQYLENVGSDIKDFFYKGKINVPKWFNQDFERNN
ncbi:MAG: hypothetical protein WC850_06715 [Candidatus Gracilibacteria bacterium]